MLFALAFLGGVLTIVSPCILPVLPFVLTRTNVPFRRGALPLLAGMALTFAAVASLAAVGGGFVVSANRWGRWAALSLMLVFGLALLLPSFAQRLGAPLVALGHRLSGAAARRDGRAGSSLLLGVATGLLWAPCAGPILGLILTGAALNGANLETSLLLLAFAAGSAASLAAALLLGARVFAALKRSLGAEEWLRRALGAAVVVSAVAIAFGLDTGFLARVSTASTTRIEEAVFGRFMPARDALVSGDGAMMAGGGAMMSARGTAGALPVEGVMPPLDGVTQWLGSEPLTRESLRGKVVLVDFWTYSCINCIRALPFVKAWHEKYRDRGLVVIGVHTPEFAFEKDLGNVRRAVEELGLTYPVAVDNDYAVWRAFDNRYWPAHYFIDAAGNIRHEHFGEGEYEASERVIQRLLAEAGGAGVATDLVAPNAEGAALASDLLSVVTPETYLGHARAEHFASPGGQIRGAAHEYAAPQRLGLNEWALAARWTVGEEAAVLNGAPGKIVMRFQARDLHLVLGPGPDGKPVRFRVTLDGRAPGADHGADVGADGGGTVDGYRLYQLIRQQGAVRERIFEIEFLGSGVAAYAFTFG
ncbi:MAG TPA: cytochrome c biogenesis protein DipZ [Gammaproteobacteria bacterium]|nr:cytochrome c biogenesis protein DipZ [Gammaproteobacteria bacterium]